MSAEPGLGEAPEAHALPDAQLQSLLSGISGLVVEYIVAIDVTRVRFPADASLPPSTPTLILSCAWKRGSRNRRDPANAPLFRCVSHRTWDEINIPRPGIEPGSSAWQAEILTTILSRILPTAGWLQKRGASVQGTAARPSNRRKEGTAREEVAALSAVCESLRQRLVSRPRAKCTSRCGRAGTRQRMH